LTAASLPPEAILPARSRLGGLLRRLSRRRLVAVSLVILLVVFVAALLAPLLAPYPPQRISVVNRLKPPSAMFLLGTDEFGRDTLSRVMHGGRLSLSVGLSVVCVAVLFGTCMGVAAGYWRRLDGTLMRLADAMMAFPDVLLAIALMAALGPSAVNVVLALGVVYIPRVARVVRGATLVLREMPFVEAADALGLSQARIVLRHILPNLVSPLMVQGTFMFASAILAEAALSFLGAGVPPAAPTWGNMIAAGQPFMHRSILLVLAPGLALVLTVMALQTIGDGLRDALDPRLRRLL
jgi:peptide/nickel transport system permease protein